MRRGEKHKTHLRVSRARPQARSRPRASPASPLPQAADRRSDSDPDPVPVPPSSPPISLRARRPELPSWHCRVRARRACSSEKREPERPSWLTRLAAMQIDVSHHFPFLGHPIVEVRTFCSLGRSPEWLRRARSSSLLCSSRRPLPLSLIDLPFPLRTPQEIRDARPVRQGSHGRPISCCCCC